MEYNRIIAVTGMPGLFELVASKTDGAIVKSLDDKSTKFVSSRIHNFSHLESIEIYTNRENINLVDIFKAMEKTGDKLPDGKDAGVLKSYFMEVYPDMDFERVYSSDMKKMVKWFEVLKKNNVEFKLSSPAPAETEEAPVEEVVAEEASAKPVKKAATKKTTATKEATAKGEEEKPKKTTKKNSTEE